MEKNNNNWIKKKCLRIINDLSHVVGEREIFGNVFESTYKGGFCNGTEAHTGSSCLGPVSTKNKPEPLVSKRKKNFLFEPRDPITITWYRLFRSMAMDYRRNSKKSGEARSTLCWKQAIWVDYQRQLSYTPVLFRRILSKSDFMVFRRCRNMKFLLSGTDERRHYQSFIRLLSEVWENKS